MSIILLNGCTSAGKTSIAAALQAILDPPHLRLGIDDAFAMLPATLHNHTDGFFFDKDKRGYVRLNLGATGLALLKAHAHAVAAMCETGVHLVLDEVLLWDEVSRNWQQALVGRQVFAVGVHCSLAELERRELARGDRIIGQARGQYDLVHRSLRYSYEIDATELIPYQAAAQIAGRYVGWRQTIAGSGHGIDWSG